jgi:hypothetical protein
MVVNNMPCIVNSSRLEDGEEACCAGGLGKVQLAHTTWKIANDCGAQFYSNEEQFPFLFLISNQML